MYLTLVVLVHLHLTRTIGIQSFSTEIQSDIHEIVVIQCNYLEQC